MATNFLLIGVGKISFTDFVLTKVKNSHLKLHINTLLLISAQLNSKYFQIAPTPEDAGQQRQTYLL